MGQKRIYDAYGGVVSVVEYDEQAKRTTFAQYQDLTPYFERNKKLQTQDDGFNQARDMRRVASIPNVLMLKWLREAGIRPVDYFRRPRAYRQWLRSKMYDPDNSFVLTAPHKRAG